MGPPRQKLVVFCLVSLCSVVILLIILTKNQLVVSVTNYNAFMPQDGSLKTTQMTKSKDAIPSMLRGTRTGKNLVEPARSASYSHLKQHRHGKKIGGQFIPKSERPQNVTGFHENDDQHSGLTNTKLPCVQNGESPNCNPTLRPKSCDSCFRSEFPMLIDEPDACKVRGKQSIDVIFLILTPPGARHRRSAIRRTWTSVTRNNTSNFRHVFLLGVTEDEASMREVKGESDHFRDMLVSDFHDSYNNLTLKTLMGLRWAATRCRHARFFLKVDGDVWVNVPSLTRVLTRHDVTLQTSLLGHCRQSPIVVRDPNSKWYISPAYYPYPTYPPYCSGVAYAGALHVAKRLVAVSKHVPFFNMEDAYIGMCLQALGYGVKNINGFLAKPVWNPCHARSDTLVTAHHIDPGWMEKFWTAQC